MRYSTVPAINLEAHVARNREIIKARRHGARWWTWTATGLGTTDVLSDDFRLIQR